MKRKCPNCKLTKPESEFYRLKKTGKIYGQCKDCNRLYRNKNKTKNAEYQKEYRDKTKKDEAIIEKKKKYYENYRKKDKWISYKKKYSKDYIKNPEKKKVMYEQHKKHNKTAKGKITLLKKRLKNAKKESTKLKLNQKIQELKSQLT